VADFLINRVLHKHNKQDSSLQFGDYERVVL
jgi:hypothetical protein